MTPSDVAPSYSPDPSANPYSHTAENMVVDDPDRWGVQQFLGVSKRRQGNKDRGNIGAGLWGQGDGGSLSLPGPSALPLPVSFKVASLNLLPQRCYQCAVQA